MQKKYILLIVSIILVAFIGAVLFLPKENQLPTIQNPLQQSLVPLVSPTPSSTQPEVTSTKGLKTYRNEQWGFEFMYPDGWSFHPNTFGSVFSKFNLVGASPEENGVPDPIDPTIVINIVTQDFADRVRTNFESEHVATSSVIVAGIHLIEYEYMYENSSQVAVLGLPLNQYRVSLGGERKYINVFNQILVSFKFLK